MKVNKAKRPEGFGATQDSKAPDDFKKDDLPNRAEVLEGMTNIVSAKKDIDLDTTAAIDLDAAKIIESLPSNYKESLAEPEIVELTEVLEEYVYQIPEGYEHLVPKKPEPILSEEVVVEEKIEEEVVEPKSPMELLAERLSGTDEKREVLSEEEKRFQLIERQLIDLRKITLETAQGTIVHGLGFGSPGSGEVRVNRMDDVAVPNLQDGDVLIWDAEMQKWIPGQAVGTGFGDMTDKVTSLENLVFQIVQYLSTHDHGDITQLSGIFQVEDPSNEYIEVEQSVGTDTGDDSTDTRTFLHSEDSTGVSTNTGAGATANSFVGVSQFTDTIPDGDTTRFIVETDSRGVYTLDGIAQPTVTLPRGDIIEFDLSGLTSPNQFGIYKNGEILEQGVTMFDDTNILRVKTGDVPSELNKLYYKNSDRAGMGWVIVITDN